MQVTTSDSSAALWEKAGYPNVPVISINLSGLESNPGFTFTPKLIQHGLYALEFDDIFLRCLYATRPYEAVPVLPTSSMKNGKRRSLHLLHRIRFLSHKNTNRCAVRSSVTLTISHVLILKAACRHSSVRFW